MIFFSPTPIKIEENFNSGRSSKIAPFSASRYPKGRNEQIEKCVEGSGKVLNFFDTSSIN